jgi:hypothetical protein
MATLIPAAGEAREVAPANGRTFELHELQALVGGYLEALRLRDGGWMFLNEDGKRLELPLNQVATVLMVGLIREDDWIVGDVVICSALEAGEGVDGDDAEA